MKKESQFINEVLFGMASFKTASLAGFTRLLIYFSSFTLQYLDARETGKLELK